MRLFLMINIIKIFTHFSQYDALIKYNNLLLKENLYNSIQKKSNINKFK